MDFAISTLTNCGPNGSEFNTKVVQWALEAYAGVIDKDPKPIALSDAELAQFTGTYETIAVWVDLIAKAPNLEVNVRIKPETLAQMQADGEDIPEPIPIPLAILPGEGDRYIVPDGPAKGMKGYFMRNAAGEIEAVHVGGRLAKRTAAVPA